MSRSGLITAAIWLCAGYAVANQNFALPSRSLHANSIVFERRMEGHFQRVHYDYIKLKQNIAYVSHGVSL